MKKGVIIVDFDGTLYNTYIANIEAYKEALKEFGYSVNREVFIKLYSGKHYLDFLPKIVDSNDIVEKIHNKKLEIYKNNYRDIEENIMLFDFLRGVRKEYYLAILTNASRKNCMGVLKYFNKDAFFDYIVTGDDVKKKKPDFEGVGKIIKHFNISRENVLMIEDDENNIKTNGIKALVLNNFWNK